MITARVPPCLPVAAALLLIFGVNPNPAQAGDCPCQTDVIGGFGGPDCISGPDGFMNLSDFLEIFFAAEGQFSTYCEDGSPFETFDVNCDGRLDHCDSAVAWCRITGGTECCSDTVCGACCSHGLACTAITEFRCEADIVSGPSVEAGVFLGVGITCSPQAGIFSEISAGDVFEQFTAPPMNCPDNTGGEEPPAMNCTGPPYTDGWVSRSEEDMCHDFGADGSPEIPAGFFGTNSDPFLNSVCLTGVPLGPTFWGEFGEADTLIVRDDDPFDACAAPSANESTVNTELVAMHLRSVEPITVTYNDGSPAEQWTLDVTVSEVRTSEGFLTATKQHCNGGTYTSLLQVYPVYTFTKVGNPETRVVLDTGIDNTPLILTQNVNRPWVAEVDSETPYAGDLCSAFHPGMFQQLILPNDCDSDGDGMIDGCLVQGTIPATSEWGLLTMMTTILVVGTIAFNRRRSAPAT